MCFKKNQLHSPLVLSSATLLLPFRKLDWGSKMGIQVPGRHSGLRLICRHQSRMGEPLQGVWVERNGPCETGTLERGCDSAAVAGLAHSISCTMVCAVYSPEGCFFVFCFPLYFFPSYTEIMVTTT